MAGAPLWQSGSNSGSGVGTSAAVPVPGVVAIGDVLVAFLKVHSDADVTIAPGFVLKAMAEQDAGTGAAPFRLYLYWKRAIEADVGTYTFAWPGGGAVTNQLQVEQIAGCRAAGDPFADLAFAAGGSAGADTPAVSVVAGANNLLIFGGASAAAGQWVAPAGFTLRQDDQGAIGIATLAQAAAGSSGPVHGSQPTGSADYKAAILAALAPPDPDLSAGYFTLVSPGGMASFKAGD